MRFTVVWKAQTERALAELWLKGHNRSAITSATESVETLLRNRADEVGESRTENRRTLIVDPIGIDYEILEVDRLVRVLAVWNLDE